MSRPATSTWPELGRSSPPRICSSVVLPEPEAPMMASRSPARTVRSTPVSTSRMLEPSRKFLETPCAASTMAADEASVMSQCLCRLNAGSTPGRIQRGKRAQHEGHRADAQHIAGFRIRGQVAHEIDLGVEEVRSKQSLQTVYQ